MRYRKLSDTGDYVFGSGELDFYIDEPAAVAQLVETNLLLWLGEWYLDIEAGVPYLQGVLGKHSLESANSVIRQAILETQGVLNIESLDSSINQDTRLYTVTATINTIYGETSINISDYGS